MTSQRLDDDDFRVLAAFRKELRKFLHFSEQAAAARGLTPQQHQALLVVRARAGRALTIGDLAEALQLMPHSTSGLVARLETLGLVARAGAREDRRRRLVSLTLSGDEMLNDLSIAHRAELRRLKPLLIDLLEQIAN